MSQSRRSHYDVTNTVNISNPTVVCEAVCGLLQGLYPKADFKPVREAFDVFARLYAGVLPGYHGCDTWYHDAQHSLDCTLAMARLLDGFERTAPAAQRVGERRTALGVICALFHDSGYIRRTDEQHYHNGAEFTLYHVTRSGDFLAELLPTLGFVAEARLAQHLVHFTGYEIALDKIEVHHPKDRWIGFLLGTADIVAQMSDRCYLEKCRGFLFHEFKACGLAGPGFPGGPKPVYSSPDDLIRKTPEFARKLFEERLDGYFQGCYRHFADHFGGANPYMDEIQGHLDYVEDLIGSARLDELRRRPRSINARVLRQILGLKLSDGRADTGARRRRSQRKAAVPAGVNPQHYVPT